MPFGKHRGLPLEEVDEGYLRWLAAQEGFNGWLKRAVKDELTTRGNLAFCRRRAQEWAAGKMEAWGATGAASGITRRAALAALKAGAAAVVAREGPGSAKAAEAVTVARWLWHVTKLMLPENGGGRG